MANTNFPLNHPLANKLWSRKLFYEALKQTYAYKFMGTSDNSLCQILEDTQKGPGDKITWGLRLQMQGRGQTGDNGLEGNEEALRFYNDAVLIDQQRHATRSSGKMSEQRVPYETREEARTALQDWWADRIDTAFFHQLTGNLAQTDTAYTGNNLTLAADGSHFIVAGGPGSTSENSLSGGAASLTQCFRLRDIDRCVNLARTGAIPIRPIIVDGAERYVVFIHENSLYQLRNDATNNFGPGWEQIQIAALQGGQVSNNPLFTGAAGMYNNTVIHVSARIPTLISASAIAATDGRRNVFCGAQSLAMAFGQGYGPSKMSWVEKRFDYDNQLGVAAGMIWGMKKAQFTLDTGTATDFGTIVVPSYAPAVT